MRKTGDLFANLEEIENGNFGSQLGGLFLKDDEPHQTLRKVLVYLRQQKRMVYKGLWPGAPEVCRPGDKAQGTINSFGSVHVRGGENLKSDENTRINGPVILGKDVTLRKGAVITGPCLIGDGVTIGVGCRIKHSILLSGSQIKFGTRISYSIIGRNVRIGGNLSSEDESFDLQADFKKRYRLPALGFFAGDDSWIGARTLIVPGVCLAMGARVHEGSRLYGEDYEGEVHSFCCPKGYPSR